MSLLFCLRVLEKIPHVSDEIAYVFQGRILASGHLWLGPPEAAEGFAWKHIYISRDRWCAIYPPGWPLILAAGWLLHAPWLMNPLLLSLTVIAVWRLAILLYDRRTANLTVIFFVISPFVLAMSAGWMSHPAVLCTILWSTIFFQLASSTEKSTHWIAASLLAGVGFLIRPFTTVVIFAPVFLWFFVKSRKNLLRNSFFIAAGFLPCLAIFLYYNGAIFGSPVWGGYDRDSTFDVHKAWTFAFAGRLWWYIAQLNFRTWGWTLPIPALFAPASKENHRNDLMLGAACFSLILFHSCFDYTDIVYGGPRYAYESIGYLAILTSRSFLILKDLIWKFQKQSFRIASVTVFVLAILYPICVLLPQTVRYHSQIYHGQTRRYVDFVNQQKIGQRALVFLSGDPYTIGTFYFENALQPSQGGKVFIRDIPSLREAAMRSFPRQEVWQLTIELQPLSGPNEYTDHWKLKRISLSKLPVTDVEPQSLQSKRKLISKSLRSLRSLRLKSRN
jgi:hypothetical protein